MLNKANFIVTEFASKEETRYTMQAIRVEPGATIATNGHFLAWASTDGQDPQSFPVVEGFEGGQKDFAPFLLDVESAEQIAKALPKKTTIPVLQYAAVHVNGVMVQDGNNPPVEDASKGIKSVSLCVTDLERPQVFRPRVPEGQFPQYQAVIPDWEKDVAFEIVVDARYLATIAKSCAEFIGKDKQTAPVRIKLYKQDVKEASESRDGKKHVYDRAIRFDATNGSQGMTVVLMPIQSDGEEIFGTYGYKERQAAREEKDGIAHMPDITLKSVIRRMKENEEYPEGTIDSLQALAS